MKVLFDKKIIKLTALSRNGGPVATQSYRFEDLDVKDNRTTNIEKAKSEVKKQVQKDRLPLETEEHEF